MPCCTRSTISLARALGFAWDPTGNGDWAVRGGLGLYNNWLTSANVQEEFRGSPPGLVTPTFFRRDSHAASSDLRSWDQQ